MKKLFLDFETFWSQDFTLSKLTTEEYVRDSRFSVHCLGYAWEDEEPQVVWGEDVKDFLTRVPWGETIVCCQNTAFDGFILTERYNVRPAFWVDTMSMFRRSFPHHKASLANIAKVLGLPAKGHEVLTTKGKTAFTIEEQARLEEYCKQDVRITQLAYKRLSPFPLNELKLIDLTLRMAVYPQLVLDTDILIEAVREEKERKAALLQRVALERADLLSNAKFAGLLRAMGVEPPTKISPTALKKRETPVEDMPRTYAFGKTDKGMKELLEHPNPEVVALVEARLGVKSTIAETRAERFLGISYRGAMPISLQYYGAHTGRWSGCLVANTKVIVYDWVTRSVVHKCIVDVMPDDLVWDGEAFVEHEGVKFQGYREVITHDGITGTPDHPVFVNETTTVSLSEAMRTGQKIMVGPEPDGWSMDNGSGNAPR